MMKGLSWLALLVLVVTAGFFVTPTHAQGFSIALSPSTVNAVMGSFVTVTVTLTGDMNAHSVRLRVAGAIPWQASFSPNPVELPPLLGSSGTSTLTLYIPSANEICPDQSSPLPYTPLQFTVQGTNSTGGGTATAPLTVYLLPTGIPPLTVSIDPSKPSYVVGDTVTLRMNSNLPASYILTVRKPDGSVWDSAQAYLPATFTKKASEPLGTYNAQLTAYYCGVFQASASFVVTPDTYDVTLSLTGLPTDIATALQADGSRVADMKGGDVRVLSYPIGTTHTFQVDQYVNGATGYRYYSALNTWTATAQGSYVFNYATQVYLDVNTDPSGVTDVSPSGWYALGSPASIAAVPAELEGSAGVKYKFAEWRVDNVARAGNGFQITMDAAHKLVAKYDTYYKLTVISDYGNPQGAGYFKAGDTATFSVTSPVGIAIQQVFVQWEGDYGGTDSTGSVTMDGPKTVTAVWATSYFQLYLIIGAIAAIAVVVALLLWRRSRAGPSTVKSPPPSPSSETSATSLEPSSSTPEPEVASKPPVSVALRCTNCGRELLKGQTFCPECGQKVTD
jgi:hypothetical protein